jgi:hypothetical protein
VRWLREHFGDAAFATAKDGDVRQCGGASSAGATMARAPTRWGYTRRMQLTRSLQAPGFNPSLPLLSL